MKTNTTNPVVTFATFSCLVGLNLVAGLTGMAAALACIGAVAVTVHVVVDALRS